MTLENPNVVCFSRRRTYLDECRRHGLFQRMEELMAENGEIVSRLANIRKEASATVLNLRPGAIERIARVFEAYQAAGFGDEWFPLLSHLLLETGSTPEEAAAIFTAARPADVP